MPKWWEAAGRLGAEDEFPAVRSPAIRLQLRAPTAVVQCGLPARGKRYLCSRAAALHLTYRERSQAGVQLLLRVQAGFQRHTFLRNPWRPALLHALAAHDGFNGGWFAGLRPLPEPMFENVAG